MQQARTHPLSSTGLPWLRKARLFATTYCGSLLRRSTEPRRTSPSCVVHHSKMSHLMLGSLHVPAFKRWHACHVRSHAEPTPAGSRFRCMEMRLLALLACAVLCIGATPRHTHNAPNPPHPLTAN